MVSLVSTNYTNNTENPPKMLIHLKCEVQKMLSKNIYFS